MGGGSDAEAALHKLRKLAANRECVNCRAQSRLGFGAICVKFGTFVCNHCKTSHQAISHRVKSATMSTWTMEEVDALRKRNGGGNEVARAKWFAKWTSKDEERYMPHEGDKIDKWKELIIMVYEDKRWYDPDAEVSSSLSTDKTSKRQSSASAMKDTANMFGSLTIKSKSSAPEPNDELDLFGGTGDSGFDAFNSAQISQTKPSTGLEDDFDFFSSSSEPSMSAAPASVDTTTQGFSFIQPTFPPSSAPRSTHQTSMANVPFPSSLSNSDDPFAILHQPQAIQGRGGAQNMQAFQQQKQQPVHYGGNSSAPVTQLQHQQQQHQQFQPMLHQQQQHQPQPDLSAQMANFSAPKSDDPFASLHMPAQVHQPQPMQMPMQTGRPMGMANTHQMHPSAYHLSSSATASSSSSSSSQTTNRLNRMGLFAGCIEETENLGNSTWLIG
mmetsp:Transcript_7830/g.13992  ORF Transcript_7830/g.13992 Transcript_7830/m.13992 type:complete len:441 (-) Transcript_7830:1422-2744(-)